MTVTRSQIAGSARRLIDDGYELWLASNRSVLDRLRAAPDGVTIHALDVLAPDERRWSIADLMRVYNVLNATAFGDKGIPLQNWVMIDLGLLPSAFLLITLPRARAAAVLTDAGGDGGRPGPAGAGGRAARRRRTATVLQAALAEAGRRGHDGPIPVAGYCAAPTPASDAWVGWSLCSAIPGLGTIAKGLGLHIYGARTLTGVAQFHDPALRVHRKFGPMRLLRAVLDLHPVPHTMVYRTDVFAAEPEPAPEPTVMLDARDIESQRALQTRLDAGAELHILSPGLVDGRVPILDGTP